MDTIHLEPYTGSSRLSQIILGGQDGLVNVLGVILGVATASHETRIVLAGGLAATFAESISMGAVAYTSQMAERDRYLAELAKEKKEIEEKPEEETEEIRAIYKAKGFSGRLLEEIVEHITSHKDIWITTMMREELGLSPIRTKHVVAGSLVVGLSAIVGSLIPLIPFFIFSIGEGVVVSLVISTIALFIVGVYKARTTVGTPIKSGVEIAIIGMGAALIGYLIGVIFQR